MPYRKRNYKRRGKPQTVKKIAHKEALKVVKKQIETKKAYHSHSYVTPTYNGYSWPLYPTSQGTSDQEYIGQKIQVKSIRIHGLFEPYDSYNSLRIVIVQWRGVPPTNTVTGGGASEILNGTGSIYSFLEDYNDTTKHRFRVLYDKSFTVTKTTEQSRLFMINIKKKMRPTQYINNEGLVQDGEIRMYMISDSSLDGPPILGWRCTVNFQDA